MADPFLGEIKMVSFNFAPRGWAFCDGQYLPINMNQALFSLFGTTFGGNGTTTFVLPDLRGRVPIHNGDGYWWGDRGGEESHTLAPAEMPQHTHAGTASASPANQASPAGNLWAVGSAAAYGATGNPVAMSAASVTNVGGSQAHTNMQPYLALNFVVALQGIFPSR
jgi:microcystin-dependent protein